MSDLSPKPKKEAKSVYSRNGSIEAHIIADMLRIENITTELREFKADTKSRLDKIENWLIGLVGVGVTTLITVLTGMIIYVVTGG